MSAGGSNLYINQNSDLYLINTATGVASLIGTTTPATFSAMVSIDGVYYGTDYPNNDQVFTFNPNTAAVTAGPYTIGGIWGLAPVTTVPAPIAGAGSQARLRHSR
jgi:hypothetical protein